LALSRALSKNISVRQFVCTNQPQPVSLWESNKPLDGR
jgi:hypothetical protein